MSLRSRIMTNTWTALLQQAQKEFNKHSKEFEGLDDLESLANGKATTFLNKDGSELKKPMVDFGSVVVGGSKTLEFKFKNKMKQTPLKFIEFTCTLRGVSVKHPNTVQPGEVVKLEVTYKPSFRFEKPDGHYLQTVFEPQFSKEFKEQFYND